MIQKIISTLYKALSLFLYSMVITKIYHHFGEAYLREKGIVVFAGNVMSASLAWNLTFFVHEHLPSPKTSLKSSLKEQPTKYYMDKFHSSMSMKVIKDFIT